MNSKMQRVDADQDQDVGDARVGDDREQAGAPVRSRPRPVALQRIAGLLSRSAWREARARRRR